MLLAAVLAFASMIAAPATAQLDPGMVPPAPLRQSVDANGVDVIRGTFVYSSPSVSIGPSYPEGLSFTYSQRGRGWLTSTNAAIFQSGSSYTVSINGVSDSFTKSGSTYTAIDGNGATLTDAGGGNLTYVSHTGVSATFAINDFTLPAYNAAFARATSITSRAGCGWTSPTAPWTSAGAAKRAGSARPDTSPRSGCSRSPTPMATSSSSFMPPT